MYEKFYQVDHPPFNNVPDPGALYLSKAHKRVLSVLEYAIMARGGFCVVTGDVGTGKTTLVRKLLGSMRSDLEIGLVTNTQFSDTEEFFRWILLAFDLDYNLNDKVALYDSFTKFLLERYQAGHPVTLIIDEAQHLRPEQLEQLRMLSNINTERGLVLQTILVGQPELWNTLRQFELRQFAQRISYDVNLGPLDSAELVGNYIEHRVFAAGGKRQLFSETTFEPIFNATGGVPRLINLVCDTGLIYGYAEQKDMIDMEIISTVIEDKHNSLTPLRRADGADGGRRDRALNVVDEGDPTVAPLKKKLASPKAR